MAANRLDFPDSLRDVVAKRQRALRNWSPIEPAMQIDLGDRFRLRSCANVTRPLRIGWYHDRDFAFQTRIMDGFPRKRTQWTDRTIHTVSTSVALSFVGGVVVVDGGTGNNLSAAPRGPYIHIPPVSWHCLPVHDFVSRRCETYAAARCTCAGTQTRRGTGS